MRGHVRERGKGNWYAVISIRDPQTGKRKVKFHSLPGCTGKKQAEAECRRILQQIDGGTYVDASKITVAEFLDRWLRDYADVKVSPKTRERYGSLSKTKSNQTSASYSSRNSGRCILLSCTRSF